MGIVFAFVICLCDNVARMKRKGFWWGGLVAVVALMTTVACTSPRTATPDIAATVTAAVNQALPTPEPTTTPNIRATVEAEVRAILDAPTPAPPLPTPTPYIAPEVAPDFGATVPNTIAQVVAQTRPGVVRIIAGEENGSGFIFESDLADGGALLLTNYHVIEGQTSVKVTVEDETTYSGAVKGVDPQRDLAVVQICCGEFTALPFGDAEGLEAGSEVVALGYPLDLVGSATVTKGIVSANRFDVARQLWIIQTDAPINPGSSGGPLLTSDGHVIGINTFKREVSSSGRPVEGLGFALSEMSVRSQLPVLKAGRYVAGPTETLTTSTTPISMWEEYAHPDLGYSLSVPADWTFKALGPNDICVSSPDKQAQMCVWVAPSVGNSSLQDLDARYYQNRQTESPAVFESIAVIRVTIGANESEAIRRSFRYHPGSQGCVLLVTSVVTLGQTAGLVFEARVCKEAEERYRGAIESIVGAIAVN